MELEGKKGHLFTGQSRRTWTLGTVCRHALVMVLQFEPTLLGVRVGGMVSLGVFSLGMGLIAMCDYTIIALIYGRCARTKFSLPVLQVKGHVLFFFYGCHVVVDF